MQNIMNDPNNIVDEMIEGFLKAHPDIVKPTNNPRVVKSTFICEGKVGIVTGGGSGHKPAFIGYVGENMVDAVAIGEVFSSPTAKAFEDAFEAADQGKGVACLYGNYSGDNMNVKMAVQRAKERGINVKTVVANDDVASAPFNHREARRGVAGEIFMWKCAGAKAAQGASLDEVISTAQKAIDNTRSIGIGIAPCTLPSRGEPNFTIKPGTMEVGIGHHGEPGVAVVPLESADKIADRMVSNILNDFADVSKIRDVVLLVSGLGATPEIELYVLSRKVEMLIEKRGINIHKAYVGNYFTSLDMKGATLSIMMLDDELKSLIDYPAFTVGFKERESKNTLNLKVNKRAVAQEEVRKSHTSLESKEDVVNITHNKEISETFINKSGSTILMEMVKRIQENKDYLGEIDGLIGDGDHGANMNKGFSEYEKEYKNRNISFTEGLEKLGMILQEKIGGSMGPIYGSIFLSMSKRGNDLNEIGLVSFEEMLESGLNALESLVGARVGDKTLVDTLSPAVNSLKNSIQKNNSFKEALCEMKLSAEIGRNSTKNMVAKFGRSARLGERSKGVLDAGATSCCIILESMADGIIKILE